MDRNNKKIIPFSKAIPIMVVFALLAFGAVFVYKYWPQSQSILELADEINKVDKNETADWKNIEGTGFSIKYPPTWFAEIVRRGAHYPLGVEIANFERLTDETRPLQLDIIVAPSTEITLKEAIRQDSRFTNESLIPEKFSDIDGYKIIYADGKVWRFFYANGNFYRIFYASSIGQVLNEEEKNVFSQMLSTFKFID